MHQSRSIFLIGPMGSGKSSVGRQLAKLAKLQFVDTDDEIEARTGVTVSWIFEVEGEAGFRKREAAIIDELTQQQNIVLSTGGGCITTPVNCEHLRKRGHVVYLQVSLNEQLARTSKRKGIRPLIDQPNPEQALQKMNQIREPIYQKLADVCYQTDGLSPLQLAKKIWHDLKYSE